MAPNRNGLLKCCGDQRKDPSDGGNGGDTALNSAILDVAVIQTLLATGLRISELANQRLEIEVERVQYLQLRAGPTLGKGTGSGKRPNILDSGRFRGALF
jgi:integrase